MRAARFTSATGGSWRSARPRLADRLACGVTTVADLFGHPPAMLARRAAAAASPGTRPRVLVAGQGITSPGGHPTSTAYAWSPTLAASAALQTDDPTQARAHIRRLAEADRADLIKITCSDLGGRVARLGRATLRAIVEQAHSSGLRVLAHVHTDADALPAPTSPTPTPRCPPGCSQPAARSPWQQASRPASVRQPRVASSPPRSTAASPRHQRPVCVSPRVPTRATTTPRTAGHSTAN